MKYKLRLPSFLANNRRRQAIAAGLALLLSFAVLGGALLATGALSGSSQPAPTPSPSVARTPTAIPTAPPTEPTLIDGVLVYPEQLKKLEKRLPLAVMLDNLAMGARPQVNLDKAELVFEAVAEGGITRFLAV